MVNRLLSEELTTPISLGSLDQGDFVSVIKTMVGVRKDLNGVLFSLKEGIVSDNVQFSETEEGQRFIQWHESVLPYIEKYLTDNDTYHMEDYLSYGEGVNKGFIGGIGLGVLADAVGLKGDIMEGVVRFVSGNGDTIGGALSRFVSKDRKSHESVDAFSYGSMLGTLAGPALQGVSAVTGGGSAVLQALYVSAYSNADNFMGSVFSLHHYIKRDGIANGIKNFMGDTFQVANLSIVVAFFVMNILLYATVLKGDPIDSMVLISAQAILLNTDSMIASAVTRHVYQKKRAELLALLSLKSTI